MSILYISSGEPMAISGYYGSITSSSPFSPFLSFFFIWPIYNICVVYISLYSLYYTPWADIIVIPSQERPGGILLFGAIILISISPSRAISLYSSVISLYITIYYYYYTIYYYYFLSLSSSYPSPLFSIYHILGELIYMIY